MKKNCKRKKILDLPVEILLIEIFKYLPFKVLLKLDLVCSTFHKLLNSDSSSCGAYSQCSAWEIKFFQFFQRELFSQIRDLFIEDINKNKWKKIFKVVYCTCNETYDNTYETIRKIYGFALRNEDDGKSYFVSLLNKNKKKLKQSEYRKKMKIFQRMIRRKKEYEQTFGNLLLDQDLTIKFFEIGEFEDKFQIKDDFSDERQFLIGVNIDMLEFKLVKGSRRYTIPCRINDELLYNVNFEWKGNFINNRLEGKGCIEDEHSSLRGNFKKGVVDMEKPITLISRKLNLIFEGLFDFNKNNFNGKIFKLIINKQKNEEKGECIHDGFWINGVCRDIPNTYYYFNITCDGCNVTPLNTKRRYSIETDGSELDFCEKCFLELKNSGKIKKELDLFEEQTLGGFE